MTDRFNTKRTLCNESKETKTIDALEEAERFLPKINGRKTNMVEENISIIRVKLNQIHKNHLTARTVNLCNVIYYSGNRSCWISYNTRLG